MKVIDKTWSFSPFHEILICEAKIQESAVFGTFLGDKVFWVDKGERVSCRVPKSALIRVGDEVDLEYLVYHNQSKFSWTWYYGR